MDYARLPLDILREIIYYTPSDDKRLDYLLVCKDWYKNLTSYLYKDNIHEFMQRADNYLTTCREWRQSQNSFSIDLDTGDAFAILYLLNQERINQELTTERKNELAASVLRGIDYYREIGVYDYQIYSIISDMFPENSEYYNNITKSISSPTHLMSCIARHIKSGKYANREIDFRWELENYHSEADGNRSNEDVFNLFIFDSLKKVSGNRIEYCPELQAFLFSRKCWFRILLSLLTGSAREYYKSTSDHFRDVNIHIHNLLLALNRVNQISEENLLFVTRMLLPELDLECYDNYEDLLSKKFYEKYFQYRVECFIKMVSLLGGFGPFVRLTAVKLFTEIIAYVMKYSNRIIIDRDNILDDNRNWDALVSAYSIILHFLTYEEKKRFLSENTVTCLVQCNWFNKTPYTISGLEEGLSFLLFTHYLTEHMKSFHPDESKDVLKEFYEDTDYTWFRDKFLCIINEFEEVTKEENRGSKKQKTGLETVYLKGITAGFYATEMKSGFVPFVLDQDLHKLLRC